MEVNELIAKMQTGIVEFSFRKVDGTTRVAHGTLLSELIMDKPKGTGKVSSEVCTYWDTDKGAWRCFRRDSLM